MQTLLKSMLVLMPQTSMCQPVREKKDQPGILLQKACFLNQVASLVVLCTHRLVFGGLQAAAVRTCRTQNNKMPRIL